MYNDVFEMIRAIYNKSIFYFKKLDIIFENEDIFLQIIILLYYQKFKFMLVIEKMCLQNYIKLQLYFMKKMYTSKNLYEIM